MPLQLYLPQLQKDLKKDQRGLQEPDGPGVWDERQGHTRMGVLSDLIVAQAVATEIHSVPDPWARVLLFTSVLQDEHHPLHLQVRGEWRGLLGLLGLRERMGMEGLTAYPVDLPKPQAGSAGYFSTVLGNVLPKDRKEIRPGESWSQFYILKYTVSGATGDAASGTAFALTSPATLVATGADYPDAMTSDEVPWFRLDAGSGRHMLTDPVPWLNTEEKRALADWVLVVQNFIQPVDKDVEDGDKTEAVKETESCDKILKLLTEFAGELDPGAILKPAAGVLSQRRLGLSHGIANVVERPLKPAETHLSHLVIETAAAPENIRYVLIDAAIAPDFRKDPKELVVHRGITLATYKSRIPESQTGVKGTLPDPNVFWVTPEFFFQSFLIYDDPGRPSSSATSAVVSNPFPGCRRVVPVGAPDPRRILLPLKEEVADLFTADYLEENFSIEWKNNGEAVCRLKLKLKSVSLPDANGNVIEGKTREYEICKTYSAVDKQLVKISWRPAVGVWPNVRSAPVSGGKAPWQRYYLFESWYGTTGTTQDFVVKPLKTAGAKFRRNQSGTKSFDIYELTSFPDFLTCEMAEQTVNNFGVRPKALMILAEPKEKTGKGTRDAVLGIDFGTTGTSIYWAWNEAKSDARPNPRQMEFKNRMLRVTNYDIGIFSNLTRELILPAQDWSTGKILSVYQVFRESEPDNPLEEMLDGHVLFANEASPETFLAGNQNGVRSDLKWGDDRQNEAADGFLTQLCFESLLELILEGAKEVEMRYSYPTAFSLDEEARFEGIWGRVIGRAKAAVGIEFDLDNEEKKNEKENKRNCEAVAATRYFTQPGMEFNYSRGAITMDIGGGTTDLALWSNDKDGNASLMAHLSVKFAGRDIFLDAVRSKPEVLKVLYPPLPIDLPDRVKNPDAFNAQVDALISAHGEKMLEGLPGKEEKPGVKELLAVMSAGLCGVAFYSGMLIGRKAQLDVYVPVDHLPIFVGGNGSRLLKWCAINSAKPGHSFYQKFAASVLAGCRVGMPELDVKVEISRSKEPKQEVAYGLVAYGSGNARQLEIKRDYTNPLAGESFLVRGAAKGLWSDTPAAESVRTKAVTIDPAMPVFKAFLSTAEITLSNRTLSRVLDNTNTRLATMQDLAANLSAADAKKALDPFKKEPIFIIAVKALLDIPIAEWLNE